MDDAEIKLDENTVEEAREEMEAGIYEHVFTKPFEWEGKKYGSLKFNFDKLTGKDTLAIERELAAKNIFTVVRSLTVECQMRAPAPSASGRMPSKPCRFGTSRRS